MLLDELRRQGDKLYRWRSYLPVPLTLLLFTTLALSPAEVWPLGPWWDWLALNVSLLGLAFRIYTIGHAPPFTSGGNVRKQVAGELNTTGAYSLVRHPLYLGNLLMWLGPTLLVRSVWVTIICVLVFWLYYERITCAEEDFLETSFGNEFRAWSAVTPALLPSAAAWRAPSASFSMRRVLRREYNALLATVALFCLLIAWRSWLHDPRVTLPTSWMILLASAVAIFVVCLVIKKRTTLLEREPRRQRLKELGDAN